MSFKVFRSMLPLSRFLVTAGHRLTGQPARIIAEPIENSCPPYVSSSWALNTFTSLLAAKLLQADGSIQAMVELT